MCTKPTKAFINPDGGRPIFDFSRGWREQLRMMDLPCLKCSECCKDYYTEWATRGSRELMMWDSSLFITLTYNNENLPKDHSLDKKHVQDFIKRLKKHFGSSKSNPIRQLYCGEYGAQTSRPHYHAILFNLDLFDKKPFRKTEQGHQVYTSRTLTALWGKGHAEFGFADAAAIAYICKYVLKKVPRGEQAKTARIIRIDGRDIEVRHEFIEPSRNPGLGAWTRDTTSIEKGYLFVNGVRKKLPKYFKNHLKKVKPEVAEKLADARFDFMASRPPETTLRKEQKEEALKKLTSLKKRL